MELAFASISLRTICESEAQAKHELGPEVAETLKHRLSDLRAATSIKDLLVGRPHILDGTDHQHMAIDLCEEYQMVISANHPKNPFTESGKLDWPRVSRIKILQIGKNHV